MLKINTDAQKCLRLRSILDTILSVSIFCLQLNRGPSNLRSFNSYVDQILPNFVPPSSSGQLMTFYMLPTLFHVNKCGLSTDPLHFLLLSTSLLNDPLFKPGGTLCPSHYALPAHSVSKNYLFLCTLYASQLYTVTEMRQYSCQIYVSPTSI